MIQAKTGFHMVIHSTLNGKSRRENFIAAALLVRSLCWSIAARFPSEISHKSQVRFMSRCSRFLNISIRFGNMKRLPSSFIVIRECEVSKSLKFCVKQDSTMCAVLLAEFTCGRSISIRRCRCIDDCWIARFFALWTTTLTIRFTAWRLRRSWRCWSSGMDGKPWRSASMFAALRTIRASSPAWHFYARHRGRDRRSRRGISTTCGAGLDEIIAAQCLSIAQTNVAESTNALLYSCGTTRHCRFHWCHTAREEDEQIRVNRRSKFIK